MAGRLCCPRNPTGKGRGVSPGLAGYGARGRRASGEWASREEVLSIGGNRGGCSLPPCGPPLWSDQHKAGLSRLVHSLWVSGPRRQVESPEGRRGLPRDGVHEQSTSSFTLVAFLRPSWSHWTAVWLKLSLHVGFVLSFLDMQCFQCWWTRFF